MSDRGLGVANRCGGIGLVLDHRIDRRILQVDRQLQDTSHLTHFDFLDQDERSVGELESVAVTAVILGVQLLESGFAGIGLRKTEQPQEKASFSTHRSSKSELSARLHAHGHVVVFVRAVKTDRGGAWKF